MDVGFYFEYDGRVIQLPVNPEKIEVEVEGNNKTTEIISLGEINILRDRKLNSISFSSFFTAEDWFPAIRTKGRFRDADYYKRFFMERFEDKKPIRFVLTGINVNMFMQSNKLVSVEKFKIKHQAGDHEDCYYDLTLKEYRSYSIQEIQLDTQAGTAKSAAIDTPAREATQITVGCSVLVNGKLYKDSYGASPGKTLSNYTGKVSIINPKGSKPYHVVSAAGGWLGWVDKGSVKLI